MLPLKEMVRNVKLAKSYLKVFVKSEILLGL